MTSTPTTHAHAPSAHAPSGDAPRVDAGAGVRAVGVQVDDLELPGLAGLVRDADGGVSAVALHTLLASIVPEELSTDYEVLDLVAAWDRLVSAATANRLAAVAEFVRRPDVIGADPKVALALRKDLGQVAREHPDDELGARLCVSRQAAGSQVGLAVDLADRFTPTIEALAAGRVDLGRARLIVSECRDLSGDHLDQVQTKAIDLATERNAARLRPMLHRAVLAVDPEAGVDRCVKARADARIIITPRGDATSEVWAQLPAEDAATIETVVDAAARRMRHAADDPKAHTLDWWRAKALAAPFVAALRTGILDGETPIQLPRSGRRAARIQVTVPASVLLGLSEAPADLRGHGPIPAFLARQIAADATWQRVLTDDTGHVLRVDPQTYRPGAITEATVAARDQLCRFPGCGARAERCHLDHLTPFPAGPTSPDNLAAECARHHRTKHRTADLTREPERTLAHSRTGPPPPVLRNQHHALVWTMPTGHRYTSTPPVVADPSQDATLIDAAGAIAFTNSRTPLRRPVATPHPDSPAEAELARRLAAVA